MTDIWDELWKNKPTSQGIYFNQLDWETKVKAEGDKLKEKAEKWDQAPKQWRTLSESYRKQNDKLEAVKTHLTKWKSEHSDWQMGRMSQWKDELGEILEAEGLNQPPQTARNGEPVMFPVLKKIEEREQAKPFIVDYSITSNGWRASGGIKYNPQKEKEFWGILEMVVKDILDSPIGMLNESYTDGFSRYLRPVKLDDFTQRWVEIDYQSEEQTPKEAEDHSAA